MATLVTILHVLVCIFLMLTVLLQAGKGGGMGAAFGGGSSSGTVFGGAGAGNFLRRLTVGAAVVFMLSSMTLAYLASSTGADSLKSYELTQKKEADAKSAEHERITGGDAGLADDEGTGAEGADLEGADLIDELDPEAAGELGLDEAGTEGDEGDEGDGSEADGTEADDTEADDTEADDTEADTVTPAPAAAGAASDDAEADETDDADDDAAEAPAGAGEAPQPTP